MSDPQHIEMLLAKERLELVGRVIAMEADEPRYVAQIRIKNDSKGHQSPSNTVLHTVKNRVEEKGYKVDFILIDKEKDSLEVDMRATILYEFPDEIHNLYVSRDTRNTFIWIESINNPLEKSYRDKLSVAVEKFSSLRNIIGSKVYFTTDFLTPTLDDVLKIIRIGAPIAATEIIANLKREGFEVPGDTFVSRILDKLRKKPYHSSKERVLDSNSECTQGLGNSKKQDKP